MRTFGVLVLIGVLGMPLVATAEESAQQPSQERVRSMGRTWGGVAMMAGGTGLMASVAGKKCFRSDFLSDLSGTATCDELGAVLGLGIGLTVGGALLATIWSDVPVMRNMTIAPDAWRGPDRCVVRVLS